MYHAGNQIERCLHEHPTLTEAVTCAERMQATTRARDGTLDPSIQARRDDGEPLSADELIILKRIVTRSAGRTRRTSARGSDTIRQRHLSFQQRRQVRR